MADDSTIQKLDEIRKILLPNFATGPGIKWREDQHGLHLIQASIPGYFFEKVMGLLGVDVAELKRLDDIERKKFKDYFAANATKHREEDK